MRKVTWNSCSDLPLSAYRSQQQRSHDFQTLETALFGITFFLSHGFITGDEGYVINDEHEGTDVSFSINFFLTNRPGTLTFWQVPDPSRPKAKKHYTSGPS